MTTATAVTKTVKLGGDLEVNRLGYGAMRIVGDGVWGEPKDPENSKAVLRKAVESVESTLSILPTHMVRR